MADRPRSFMDEIADVLEGLDKRGRPWPWPTVPKVIEAESWECLAGEGVVIVRGVRPDGALPVEIRLRPAAAEALAKKLSKMAKAAAADT